MPGLDKNRLIDSRQIDDEIICGICLAIFVDPMVTPCCRQTYCGDCIKQWLETNNKCPYDRKVLTINDLIQTPRFVINMLNKLEFKCTFACSEKLTFETQNKHETTCKNNPTAKCLVCDEINGEINSHKCIENLLRSNSSLKLLNRELSERCENYVKEANKLRDDFIAIQEQHQTDISNLNSIISEKSVTINKLNEKIEKLKFNKSDLNNKNKLLSSRITKINEHFYDLKKSIQLIDETLDEKATNLVAYEHNSNVENTIECIKINDNYGFVYRAKFKSVIDTVSEIETSTKLPKRGKKVLINGNLWWIEVDKYTKIETNDQYLTCFIYCKNENNSIEWSCDVIAAISLVKSNLLDPSLFKINAVKKRLLKTNYTIKFQSILSEQSPRWGYKEYILWSDLFAEGNNYIRNDSIIFEVNIEFK